MPRSRKRAARGARRGRPPGSGGAGNYVGALRGYHADLVSQRDSLDARINALEQLLGMSGAAGARSGGARRAASGGGRGGTTPTGRPLRSGSLKDYIQRVLSSNGGVMAVKDITDGVVAAGYKSKNQTLAKSVGIALTEMNNVSKVGRGKFRIG